MSIKIVSWNCHMGLKIDKVQKILNDNTFACADIYAIQECEEKGMSFTEVIEAVEDYIAGQVTWFVLESVVSLIFSSCIFFS